MLREWSSCPHRSYMQPSWGHGSSSTAPFHPPEHQQGCDDDEAQRGQDHCNNSERCGVVIRAWGMLYRQQEAMASLSVISWLASGGKEQILRMLLASSGMLVPLHLSTKKAASVQPSLAPCPFLTDPTLNFHIWWQHCFLALESSAASASIPQASHKDSWQGQFKSQRDRQ